MLFVIFFIFALCDAIWVSEEYWTTVSSDGSLLGGRTIKDFLIFHTVYFNVSMGKAYVAFWVKRDEYGYYEAFGHAYLVKNGVCARFVDRYQKAKTICGGFRVLSRSNNEGNLTFKFVQATYANTDEAVEYRGRQVAKILNWTRNEIWYGNAFMQEVFAESINSENEYVKISYYDDPFSYQQNVHILVRCSMDDPEAGKSQYNNPSEQHQLGSHSKWLRFNQQKLHKLRRVKQLREQQGKENNSKQHRYQ